MQTRILSIALAVAGSTALSAELHAQPVDTPAPAPAPTPAPAVAVTDAPQPSYGYKGGFFFADGKGNKMTIQGRVQSRFEFENADGGDSESAFSIPRARLTLRGSAHDKKIGYKFQTDFGKGFASLKDFYVDYKLGGGEMRVRAGQFKKPFGRQQINSSSKLEFVDRSIVDKAFNNGRDIGVEVHNNLGKGKNLEWAVGVFNGSGDKGQFSGDVTVDPMTGEGEVSGGKFSNVPSAVRPAIVARIDHNSEGFKGYSEADLEGGPLRYSVGAAAMMHFSGGDSTAAARAGADFVVKSQGLSATGGIYVAQEGADEGDLSYTGLGTYAQLGYVLARKWQPALRYALLNAESGDKSHEIAGAISLYEFKHNFKWQSDVAVLINDIVGMSTNDLRARTQLQLTF
jgi:phosphate-selective porin